MLFLFFFALLIQNFLSQILINWGFSYTDINMRFYSVNLNNNKQAIYLSAKSISSGTISILKINATNLNSLEQNGQYFFDGNQTNPYNQIYLLQNGFLIASSDENHKPIVFNQSSLIYLSSINWFGHFFMGVQLTSKGIFVFTSNTGHLGYFKTADLPNPNLNFVFNHSNSRPIYIKPSPDDRIMVVTFDDSGQVRIYNTQDWSLINTWNSSGNKVMAVEWSLDNHYLALFPYDKMYAQIYERQSWSLIDQVDHGYESISWCSLHKQSITILCWANMMNKSIFIMNWYDFFTKNMYNTTIYSKIKVSSSSNRLALYSPENTKIQIMSIGLLCQSGSWYNPSTSACVQCGQNCIVCGNAFACAFCQPNYQVINGSCQPCHSLPSTTIYYDTSSFLCVDYGNFCSLDTYFNVSLEKCVICGSYCVNCISITDCSVCIDNYQSINGTCYLAIPGNLQKESNNSCTKCPSDSQICIPNDSCNVCRTGYYLNEQLECVVDNGQLAAIFQALMAVFESQSVRTVNKVPGNRIILKHFASNFYNIDRLTLYIYHKKDYGPFIKSLFEKVRQFEMQKWSFISNEFMLDQLGINISYITQKTDFKFNFSSQTFIQIQQNGTSFITNTIQYFLANIPLVIILFFALKTLSLVTIKSKISKILSIYSLNATLIFMLIQGNVQQFSYWFVFDVLHFNHSNSQQKLMNMTITSIFCLFFLYLIGFFLLFKALYLQKACDLSGNYKIKLQGIISLMVESGLINFFFGTFHILLENSKELQILMLGSTQIFYMLLIINSTSKKLLYKNYVGWSTWMASFLRLGFISNTFLKSNYLDFQQQLYEKIEILIINLYLANIGINFAMGAIGLLISFLKFNCRDTQLRRQKKKKIIKKINIEKNSKNQNKKMLKNKANQHKNTSSRQQIHIEPIQKYSFQHKVMENFKSVNQNQIKLLFHNKHLIELDKSLNHRNIKQSPQNQDKKMFQIKQELLQQINCLKEFKVNNQNKLIRNQRKLRISHNNQTQLKRSTIQKMIFWPRKSKHQKKAKLCNLMVSYIP